MKAAFWRGIKDVSVEDARAPIAASGEAILRVESCAICGSDVRTYFHGNERVAAPRILGHEISGTIVSIGADTSGVVVGDRVTVGADLPCGKCRYCKQGAPNNCQTNLAIGYQYDGGFAEFMTIPAVALAGGPVQKFSADITFDEAALAEPLACCINGLELGQMRPGRTVAIWGAGPIGSMLADLAYLGGAERVFMIDINDQRLNSARARHPDLVTLDARCDVRQPIMDHTDGRGVELALTANSSVESHRQAMGVMAKRGVLNLFGGLPKTAPALEVSSNWLHYNEICLTGSHGSTPKQHAEAIRLIEARSINVGDLISHRYPLSEIRDAFDSAISKSGMKVMVHPSVI